MAGNLATTFADATMSDPKNVIDAMVAMRSAIEQKLLSNADYVMLCSLDAAIRAHNVGISAIWVGPQAAGRNQSQTDVAHAVLAEIGQPTPTNELLAAVSRKGISIGGANPNTNFSSALSRDLRFKSVHWNGSRRWWFTDLAMPPDPRPELAREPAMA
jgi:hypothetical protein